jgi:ABC-type branched-subunit amino acid transport system substrate-binding protein
VSDPTVDSQILTLKASGADTFINITTPKFGAQAIRKVYDSGWKPLHIVNNVSASIGSVLTPAGAEKSVGVITSQYMKDPLDERWKNDKGMKDWYAFMTKYYPDGDLKDSFNVYGYAAAQTLAQVLKQCGDNLTRENVMKQAANLKDWQPSTILPGININTSPTDFAPIKSMQLVRFDGTKYVPFGDVISK